MIALYVIGFGWSAMIGAVLSVVAAGLWIAAPSEQEPRAFRRFATMWSVTVVCAAVTLLGLPA